MFPAESILTVKVINCTNHSIYVYIPQPNWKFVIWKNLKNRTLHSFKTPTDNYDFNLEIALPTEKPLLHSTYTYRETYRWMRHSLINHRQLTASARQPAHKLDFAIYRVPWYTLCKHHSIVDTNYIDSISPEESLESNIFQWQATKFHSSTIWSLWVMRHQLLFVNSMKVDNKIRRYKNKH